MLALRFVTPILVLGLLACEQNSAEPSADPSQPGAQSAATEGEQPDGPSNGASDTAANSADGEKGANEGGSRKDAPRIKPIPKKLETPPIAATTIKGPCGGKGEPACPLQAWMEEHLQVPMEKGNLPKVASALRQSTAFVPDPRWNKEDPSWKAIALEGANAADHGKMAKTKSSCKRCHRAFRKRYRDEFGNRILPSM